MDPVFIFNICKTDSVRESFIDKITKLICQLYITLFLVLPLMFIKRSISLKVITTGNI